MTVKKMLRRAAALLILCLLAVSIAAAEEMEKGTRENPYRLGEVCAFSAEVLADGSPRLDAAETDFATFEMTLTLDNYLSPAYFEENYGRLYKFDGTQAGAQVTIANESAAAIVPQNAFWLTLEGENGAQETGYQLMDAEIAGSYGTEVAGGESATLYKRFDQAEGQEMTHLVLTYCQGGERVSRYFLLEERIVYAELQNGSRGDDVTALQTRLIDLGYLDDEADGIFGRRTEAAVRAARQAAGMDDSGVADDNFQHALYAEDFPAAAQQ